MRTTRERGRKGRAAGRRTAGIAAVLTLVLAAAAAAEDKPAPAAPAGQALKLSGFTNVLGVAQAEGTDSLAVRRARFSLAGEVARNIRVKFQVDAVKSPILVDAQIEAVLLEAAVLRFGQFRVPFGIEGNTSSADLDTIDRSQPVNKLAPGFDLGTSGRDIGAVIAGRVSVFEYAAGFFNGAGANKAETNDRKDLSGRLVFRPSGFLAVGASVYDGHYSAAAGAPVTDRKRTGFDAALVLGDVSIKAELVKARDAAIDKRGWYVQAGWFVLPKKVQVMLKADGYDKDTALAGDRANLTTTGLNWFFAGRTKLQVNYVLTRDESGVTVNRALLVQFQAAF
jgi:phosphate-selective porin